MEKFTSITASIGTVCAILFNPITSGAWKQSEIATFSGGVNDVLKSFGSKRTFSCAQMTGAIFFVEYVLLGIFLTTACKTFSNESSKNVIYPLFIGLLTAVGSGYYRSVSGGSMTGLEDVVWTFSGLALGVFSCFVASFIKELSRPFSDKSIRRRGG